MRITIIAVGSRGDTQPYIALGRGLDRAGHSVTIAAHEIFRGLVTAHGLAFEPIAGDPRAVVADPATGRWLASGRRRDMLRAARTFLRSFPPVFDALLADYVRVTEQSDMLIYSVVAAPALSVAERRGIPAIAGMLQPLHPTRAFPTIGLPSQPQLGAHLNLASHYAATWMLSLPMHRAINAWRQRTLKLPPLSARPSASWPSADEPPERAMAIYGFSPRVVPRPIDWNPTVHVTGYWVLDPPSAWRPPAELEAFLAAGPPPVYIGFGSMTPVTPEDARRLTRIAIDALERTGQRGILLRGWGALGEDDRLSRSDRYCIVDDVPHEWLFPRMVAIVHHGGSGTTGAALRAGVPSIVIPLGFDQGYWAGRVRALGVGPGSTYRRNVTADWLTDAIQRALHDRPMRERAAALGAQLRAEQGVDAAVGLITRAGSPPAAGGRTIRA